MNSARRLVVPSAALLAAMFAGGCAPGDEASTAESGVAQGGAGQGGSAATAGQGGSAQAGSGGQMAGAAGQAGGAAGQAGGAAGQAGVSANGGAAGKSGGAGQSAGPGGGGAGPGGGAGSGAGPSGGGAGASGVCGASPPKANAPCEVGTECTWGNYVGICDPDGWFFGQALTAGPLPPGAACNPMGEWDVAYDPKPSLCGISPSYSMEIRPTASGALVASFLAYGGPINISPDGCTIKASASAPGGKPPDTWTDTFVVSLVLAGDTGSGTFSKSGGFKGSGCSQNGTVTAKRASGGAGGAGGASAGASGSAGAAGASGSAGAGGSAGGGGP